jgi:uncharacterized protein
MREPVTVANSSCLIALDSIDQLELLRQLYQIVTIPEAVVHECGTPLPAWFRIEAVQNKSLVKTLRLGLGPGESEAIALAGEVLASRLILDDRKARRAAQQLGLPVVGTLALLLRAKQEDLIPNVREVLDDLAVAEFWISDALRNDTLRRAGE